MGMRNTEMASVPPPISRPFHAASYFPTLVLLGAFALRLAVLAQGAELPIVRDEAQYEKFALQLRDHFLAYTEIYRPPLFPAFVAFSFWLGGAERFSVGLMQALLDTASVALIYALTRRLFHRSGVALLAAGLYAIYPEAVALTRQFYTETLFNFLVLATLYLLVRFTPTRAHAPLFVSGIVFGLAALTRELALYFALVVIPIWFFIRAGGLKRAPLLQTAAFGAGFLLVLIPWSARNYRLEGRFVPIATEGEKNILQDNLKAQARIECGTKSKRPDAAVIKCIPYPAMSRQMLNQAPKGERMRVAVRGALQVIDKYPFAWLNAKLEPLTLLWAPPNWKLHYFRANALDPTERNLFNWVVGSYHVLFLVSAVIGVVAARDDSAKLLIALYLLYVLAIFIVTHFQARYREPLFVVFMPYAALGIATVTEFARRRVSVRQWFTKPRFYAGGLLLGLIALLMLKSL